MWLYHSKLPPNRNLHVAYKFVSVMVLKALLKVLDRIFGTRFFKYRKRTQIRNAVGAVQLEQGR